MNAAEERVQQIVAEAPPLTDEQRSRLAQILARVGGAS